jgi:hypothetical protein
MDVKQPSSSQVKENVREQRIVNFLPTVPLLKTYVEATNIQISEVFRHFINLIFISLNVRNKKNNSLFPN